jgi:hypothetical protein
MNRRWKLCFFGALLLGAMTPSTIALAQYPGADSFIWQKPHQTHPHLYGPNGSDPAPQFRRPSQSTSSEYSSEQIRVFANRVNNQLNGSPNRERMMLHMCSGNGDSVFRSKGFSPANIVVFKQELGC